ncbi:DinB family protein [Flavobacterium aestivum]|uniref:DinB family protein n=1 Tax=Flavobacterium aestivum TaxID=3003257 RepID=UPI002286BF02|nr:DinB family protein [Flavobacterium aestivum]
MIATKKRNAVNAILAEYQKAILELQSVIQNISDEDLAFIIDTETKDPDCKSIQTVLAHVVSSGYSYCIYIRELKNEGITRPEKINRKSVSEYKKDLDDVIQFTYDTFSNISDNEIEKFDESEKMRTSWKQLYDIEQMMEHAIVHVLRHRRQIENFKTQLGK